MEKINKIQVNGVTYEIGGSSIDDNSYIIPLAYSELSNGDKSNVINSFGGTEGFNSFKTAVSEGKNIYIQLKNGVVPAFVVVGTTYIRINWYDFYLVESSSSYPRRVTTTIAYLSSRIISFKKGIDELSVDKKIVVDIYDLNESSSSEDIKSALTESWNQLNVKFYGARTFRNGAITKSYNSSELGVSVTDESDGYTYKISCNISGCFGKEKGGIIHIKENTSTKEYSVIKIDAF